MRILHIRLYLYHIRLFPYKWHIFSVTYGKNLHKNRDRKPDPYVLALILLNIQAQQVIIQF